MMTRHQAKTTLKRKGWSQRKAAPHLKVSYEHLNRVLNGHRFSTRLLNKIEVLPSKEEVAK